MPRTKTSIAEILLLSAGISLVFGVAFFMVMMFAFFMAVPPVLAFIDGTIKFLGIQEQGGFFGAIAFWVFMVFIVTALFLYKRDQEP
jgi:hypothetical protein